MGHEPDTTRAPDEGHVPPPEDPRDLRIRGPFEHPGSRRNRLMRTLFVVRVAISLVAIAIGTIEAYHWRNPGDPLPSLAGAQHSPGRHVPGSVLVGRTSQDLAVQAYVNRSRRVTSVVLYWHGRCGHGLGWSQQRSGFREERPGQMKRPGGRFALVTRGPHELQPGRFGKLVGRLDGSFDEPTGTARGRVSYTLGMARDGRRDIVCRTGAIRWSARPQPL